MEQLLLMSLLIAVLSFLAGSIGALLGLGGGIIIVPILTLFLHLPFQLAVGASIVSVIATSSGAAATYVKDHLSNLRVGMFLEIATTTGAISGAILATVLRGSVLYVIFSLVLFYSLWPMGRKIFAEMRQIPLRGVTADPALAIVEGVQTPDPLATKLRLDSSYHDKAIHRTVEYHLHHVPLGLSMMYIAGMSSGLLGIGSGAFKVLAMDNAMGMPMKASSATSNFMIGVTAAASAGIYFLRGDISPLVAAPVALGVLAGSVLGTRLLTHMAGEKVRLIFAIVLTIIALQMLLRGFGLQI